MANSLKIKRAIGLRLDKYKQIMEINQILFFVSLTVIGGIIYFFFSLAGVEEKKDENDLNK